MHVQHHGLLHVFAKRSRSIYSIDLLAPSSMSLVPRSGVIGHASVAAVVGPIRIWELAEIDA